VETKVERYTWLVTHELCEARLASVAGLKDDHLEWARRFAVKRDEALLMAALHEQ